MRRPRRPIALFFFASGLMALAGLALLFRFAQATDYLYHALVKDPPRHAPSGDVLVAPADGTVLYVTPIEGGVIPEVVKRGVPVPLADHLKTQPAPNFGDGFLIGIYMNGDGVHINRVPISGRVKQRIIFNGPHMNMSPAERIIILTQLLPGWAGLKKLLGFSPYDIAEEADFILKSARETLVIADVRGVRVYVTRIADYGVGKILTWVQEGQQVFTGQKLGMITWGSQTDIFVEATPGLAPQVRVGQYLYAGETILATF